MMDGGWGSMTPVGWLSMVVLWVAVIGVVVWAVARIFPAAGAGRGAFPGSTPPPTADREDPERLLERRLAAGEIDAETYDQVRQRLDAARQAKGGA